MEMAGRDALLTMSQHHFSDKMVERDAWLVLYNTLATIIRKILKELSMPEGMVTTQIPPSPVPRSPMSDISQTPSTTGAAPRIPIPPGTTQQFPVK